MFLTTRINVVVSKLVAFTAIKVFIVLVIERLS